MGTIYTFSTLILFAHGCQSTTHGQLNNLGDWVSDLGDWNKFDQRLSAIQEPEEKDLLLLSLAVAHPRHATSLCQRMITPGGKEKCKQVLGRPHLRIAP